VDSSGDLYVADTGNNRVLYFPTGSTTATRVYGQGSLGTDFTDHSASTGSAGLNQPGGVALDSNDNLYVADTGNNRVLYFPARQATATRVYGQGSEGTDFTDNSASAGSTGLNQPGGVTLDSSGDLYIADRGNNRVLYFPSGQLTATSVYGQSDFSGNQANRNAGTPDDSRLNQPGGVALDSDGNLYVTDTGNNRVLYFPSGETTATSVYGQGGSFTDGTTNNGGLSASSLDAPAGVALDLNDNLYISDAGNNRVLYYPSGQTTATRVYGQGGDFTNNTANNNGIGSASLSAPAGVALDSSGDIYVADAPDNRVLQYQDKLHVTSQPDSTITVDANFSTAFSLTDVGSGLAFADFAGSVSILIKSGTGAQGATLGGTTTVTATSGVATFSSLSIDTAGTGYVLTGSSSGVGQVDTNSFDAVGMLSETITSISSPSVTLNGTDQSMTWQMVLDVTDTRGTGAGWNLTITSTQFKTLTGKTLPTTATRITAVDAACTPASSCTSATNTLSYPLAVPAGSTAPTPVKFFNAASGSGQGHLQLTVMLSTTVPANSYKGTYTNTITPAINSGS